MSLHDSAAKEQQPFPLSFQMTYNACGPYFDCRQTLGYRTISNAWTKHRLASTSLPFIATDGKLPVDRDYLSFACNIYINKFNNLKHI